MLCSEQKTCTTRSGPRAFALLRHRHHHHHYHHHHRRRRRRDQQHRRNFAGLLLSESENTLAATEFSQYRWLRAEGAPRPDWHGFSYHLNGRLLRHLITSCPRDPVLGNIPSLSHSINKFITIADRRATTYLHIGKWRLRKPRAACPWSSGKTLSHCSIWFLGTHAIVSELFLAQVLQFIHSHQRAPGSWITFSRVHATSWTGSWTKVTGMMKYCSELVKLWACEFVIGHGISCTF